MWVRERNVFESERGGGYLEGRLEVLEGVIHENQQYT